MKTKYRVEVPDRKRLNETFSTANGAFAYAAMLFFRDRLTTRVVALDKPKPKPLPTAPF